MPPWAMAAPAPAPRETLVIHPDCRERFLPRPQGGHLDHRGVQLCGISELRTDYRIGRFARKYHTVFLTRRGTGRIAVSGEAFTSTPGMLLVIPGHLPYTMTLGKGGWDVSWFHLKTGGPWPISPASGHRHRPARHLRPIHQAMEDYLTESSPNPDGHGGPEGVGSRGSSGNPRTRPDAGHGTPSALTEAIAAVILEYLHRELSGGDDDMATRREAVASVWRRVRRDPARDWTVAALAAELAVTPRHFTRLCHTFFGQDPRALLTDHRLAHARELLADPDYTLEAVADRVGFANPFALSEAFRRRMGVRPSVWRARARSTAAV